MRLHRGPPGCQTMLPHLLRQCIRSAVTASQRPLDMSSTRRRRGRRSATGRRETVHRVPLAAQAHPAPATPSVRHAEPPMAPLQASGCICRTAPGTYFTDMHMLQQGHRAARIRGGRRRHPSGSRSRASHGRAAQAPQRHHSSSTAGQRTSRGQRRSERRSATAVAPQAPLVAAPHQSNMLRCRSCGSNPAQAAGTSSWLR